MDRYTELLTIRQALQKESDDLEHDRRMLVIMRRMQGFVTPEQAVRQSKWQEYELRRQNVELKLAATKQEIETLERQTGADQTVRRRPGRRGEPDIARRRKITKEWRAAPGSWTSKISTEQLFDDQERAKTPIPLGRYQGPNARQKAEALV